MSEYGYSVEVPQGYDEAVIRARLALRREGFSILTEMHVGGMLGPEAGAGRQYLIMGVWNSIVEQRKIAADLQVAVHLPCNVVIQETDAAAIVAALDPAETMEASENAPPDLAEHARAALLRALDGLSAPLP